MANIINGEYTAGNGIARSIVQAEPRISEMRGIFGSSMVGTFNIRCRRKSLARLHKYVKPSRVGYWTSFGKSVPIQFHLVKISNQTGESVMGWALNWKDISRSMSANVEIEVFSRKLIPDAFKSGNLIVEFCDPWTKEFVSGWWPKAYKKWFQSFEWGLQRSDNNFVWAKIYKHVKFSDRTVLDIGCNTGWYAFQAAKYGATVDAFDINPKTMDITSQIGRFIESSDVNLHMKDPGGNYDIIFYLSVHHQIDRQYDKLKSKINSLKKRCGKLFVELIVPPPHIQMSEKTIDHDVGGQTLARYAHKVRCVRKIYLVNGDLEDKK